MKQQASSIYVYIFKILNLSRFSLLVICNCNIRKLQFKAYASCLSISHFLNIFLKNGKSGQIISNSDLRTCIHVFSCELNLDERTVFNQFIKLHNTRTFKNLKFKNQVGIDHCNY